MTDVEKRLHKILGGSTASRWLACTGSVFYLKDLPPELPSEAAEEGTIFHDCIEMATSDLLDHKETGVDPEIRAHLWSKNDVMEEHVRTYRDLVWKNVFRESSTGKFWGFEEKVVLDEHLEMSGYLDLWTVEVDDRAKRAGAIVDGKYGYYPVTADKNTQLAFYAVGLQEAFIKAGKPLDYIRGIIIQPRAKNKAVYEETRFTAKELDSWKKKFFKAARRIFVDKKPKFKTGEHCRFCRAQGICATYKKEAEDAIGLSLVEIEKTVLPEPAKISEEALVQIVLQEERILNFVKSCKKYAFEKLASGQKLDGLKLVEGSQGRRAWKKDNIEAIGADLMSYGVKEPYDLKLKTIGAIEKELSKCAGKEEAKAILAPYCPKGSPSITIVASTDPRPIAANPSDLMGEVLEIE